MRKAKKEKEKEKSLRLPGCVGGFSARTGDRLYRSGPVLLARALTVLASLVVLGYPPACGHRGLGVSAFFSVDSHGNNLSILWVLRLPKIGRRSGCGYMYVGRTYIEYLMRERNERKSSLSQKKNKQTNMNRKQNAQENKTKNKSLTIEW